MRSAYVVVTVVVFGTLAAVLAAFHAPGELSVDSVMALYEAMKGVAVGWGPTFMAATLAWLGGGAVGATLFVAMMCLLTYGCYAALLIGCRGTGVPRWQIVIAFVLALNPLFMFYVGIIWKDVMQATVALVVATLMLLAVMRSGRMRYVALGIALIVAGMLTPIRQQGILLLVPLASAIGWVAVRDTNRNLLIRLAMSIACICISVGVSEVFYSLASTAVKPQSSGPVSVGIFTIQAYDIAGMIANAPPGDPSAWSNAPESTKNDIKHYYSSQRIDSVWQHHTVSSYFNSLSAHQYMSIWLSGIRHDPGAYLESRFNAFGELLGFGHVVGCVPAFAGIGAIPEQVQQLGLQNGMDARAHVVGRLMTALVSTPVFRNWFYAGLLIVVSVLTMLRLRGHARATVCGIIASAWLYFFSFLPTTIACDVRYLYPVAVLVTAIFVFILVHVPLTRAKVIT